MDHDSRSATSSQSPGSAIVGEDPDVPSGVFHRVERGQTLWRIARAYGVRWQELAKVNGITDPRAVPVGLELLIPGGKLVLDVPPLRAPFPSSPQGSTADTHGFAPRTSGFRWPVPGGAVLSPFGAPRRSHLHAGVDIRGDSGQEVLAAASGRVTHSGPTGGAYGRVVMIDHGGGIETLYAHNSKLLVKVGDVVEKGSPVALVGRTGNATADHCHFEVRRDRSPVDPMSYYADVEELIEEEPASAKRRRDRNGNDIGAAEETGGEAAEK